MNRDIELLRRLCLLFGPSGCEGEVRSAIRESIRPCVDELEQDKLGNLIGYVDGADNSRTLMIAAHMDEVGMMITNIESSGQLRFDTVGGIDAAVLCGKRVVVWGHDRTRLPGIISAKPIHLQSKEEREKATTRKSLYIDIGASDRADAQRLVSVGDFAVFDSDFVRFGEAERRMKGKAIDDRLGCAVMISVLERLRAEGTVPPVRLAFAFTVREEVGFSGAKTAAYRINPSHAVALESTAIADLPDVSAHERVGDMGRGGVLSLADKGALYCRAFVGYALSVGREKDIPVQLKRYVSGGNDARHIQQSAAGVRVLALSAPTRYLHSASCVADLADYRAMQKLVYEMIVGFGRYLAKEDM
ncbi:MAG: M20/M25/M40 family metallo-hydrolase [Eubacteriales bacterium]